jgi:polyisoprenoid-binding protein YceI
MQSKLSLSYLIFIIIPLFSASNGQLAKDNDNKATTDVAPLIHGANEKYTIDKKGSLIKWKCLMALTSGGHNGYVYLSKGEFQVEKGQLVGGTFEVDMNTITDPIHGSDNNLINHLKDPDFFDVAKFPISTFIITSIAPADSGK